MSDTTTKPPIRKSSSLEMTAVRPGPRVPLKSLASLDIDPNHPETIALMARAQEGNQDAETMEPCPGPCRTCPCCSGTRMVSPSRAAAWKTQQRQLETLSEPSEVKS
jgi:hypothetical protein